MTHGGAWPGRGTRPGSIPRAMRRSRGGGATKNPARTNAGMWAALGWGPGSYAPDRRAGLTRFNPRAALPAPKAGAHEKPPQPSSVAGAGSSDPLVPRGVLLSAYRPAGGLSLRFRRHFRHQGRRFQLHNASTAQRRAIQFSRKGRRSGLLARPTCGIPRSAKRKISLAARSSE
jgi:hypothetical protein